MFRFCFLVLSVLSQQTNSTERTITEDTTNEPFENENLLRIALEKHIQGRNYYSYAISLFLQLTRAQFASSNFLCHVRSKQKFTKTYSLFGNQVRAWSSNFEEC